MQTITVFIQKNKTIISMISALGLFIGGFLLCISNYNNFFASLLIVLAYFGFWIIQENPRSKLLTIGLFTLAMGIAFTALVASGNPFFHQLRVDPSLRSGNNIFLFLGGVTIFFSMIFLLVIGFVLWGISFLRSETLSKIAGICLIIAGLVAIASNASGFFLALAGIFWMFGPVKELAKSILHLLSQ